MGVEEGIAVWWRRRTKKEQWRHNGVKRTSHLILTLISYSRHLAIQVGAYLLSREVVGGQQSSNEANVDFEHRHLSILEKQESMDENVK